MSEAENGERDLVRDLKRRFAPLVLVALAVGGLAAFTGHLRDLVVNLKTLVGGSEEIGSTCGLDALSAEQAIFRAMEKISLTSRAPDFTENALWKENGSCRSLGEVLSRSSENLVELEAAVRAGRVYNSDHMIFAFGSAGSGKSAVAKHFASLPGVLLVDLGKLRFRPEENYLHPDTELEEDLTIGTEVVSKMAELKSEIRELSFSDFIERYSEAELDSATTLVVDGLDELHPYSSTAILNNALQHIKTQASDQNIIFFGRGEAFRGYYRQHKEAGRFKAIPINPIYVGEEPLLSWFVCDYLSWPHREQTPDYIPPGADMAASLNEVERLLNENPRIAHFMFSAEPANVVLRNLRYQRTEEFSSFLFFQLVDRNRRTHNRPTHKQAQAWPIYASALTQAGRILEPIEIVQGEIKAIVKPGELIEVPLDGECHQAELAEVLNRSGVVSLDPFNVDQLEYEFWPIVMQDFVAKGDLLPNTGGA